VDGERRTEFQNVAVDRQIKRNKQQPNILIIIVFEAAAIAGE